MILKKCVVIMLCWVPVLALAQQTPLPDIGSSTNRLLTPAEERILGQVIMQNIYQHLSLVNDPFSQQYLQRLGDKLVANSANKTQPYTFFIVDAPSINAFALPGGFIGVHTGLLLQTRNESELAGVLSHEIAHVSQRHLARMFEKAQQIQLPTLAAMLGAIAISAANPALGSTLLAGSMAGAQQSMINYTRHNEEEADRVGMDTLAKSGHNPKGMSDFFERMDQANRYNSANGVPEFLRTHPMTSNRMADAQNRLANYPPTPPQDETDYQLVKERLRNFTAKPNTLEAYYKAQPINDDASTYGYAFYLTYARKYKEANQLFDELIAKHPENIFFEIGEANLLAEQKKFKSAVQIANKVHQDYPNNYAVLYELGDIHLRANEATQTISLLKAYLRRRDGNPDIYRQLATAYGDLKHEKQALMAQADYYASLWNYPAAIRQLEMAKKTKPINDYHTAMIDAKIKKFESALALQKRVESSL